MRARGLHVRRPRHAGQRQGALQRLQADRRGCVHEQGMMMRHLETVWHEFERKVMPQGAGEIQRREMRRAFFSGAWAIYAIMMNQMDADREHTANDLELMRSLD